MTRTILAILAGAALAAPALAQPVPVPVMTDEDVAGLLAPGGEVETRLDGDLNGDGEIDTVYVERGEEMRQLHVRIAYRSEVDLGHIPAGDLTLDPYPVPGATASLSITGTGVLVVEDLTGGTSATASTYRYRYDPAEARMRLIGLDAKVYSRTNAHGWSSVSWNLLNGDYVTESAELLDEPVGDSDYADPVTKRSKRKIGPIYMEETPSAEELLTRP
jgi:hypothetical protein